MSTPLISVQDLSKRYFVGHESTQRTGYHSLRETIVRRARKLGRKSLDFARGRQIIQGDEVEEFWALKDVSFEVKRGEVLGVIGRNGAGKSTLLKILSQITEQTDGRVTLRGRVASLLEVGTGFHPELTGRENIFLNGAILGMSRAEIKSKFDEIVAFAEVDRFLDTPVKRYSSGMYIRLAFAVAAHLDPEILIIDEVLAVGDVVFQKKCLGKMKNVAAAGRTVLFVSHNLSAIANLTHRAILLEHGRISLDGKSRDVVSSFLKSTQDQICATGDLSAYRRPNRTEGFVNICSVEICEDVPGTSVLGVDENVFVDIGLDVIRPIEKAIITISVLNDQMETLTVIHSADAGFDLSLDSGFHTIRCRIGDVPLMPGNYSLHFGIAAPNGAQSWDVLECVPGFKIEAKQSLVWPDRPGNLLLNDCAWMHKRASGSQEARVNSPLTVLD